MNMIAMGKQTGISRVVAGCMRLTPGVFDAPGLLRFAQSCMEMGITSFDHAPVYGNTACERFFGEAVVKNLPGRRGDFQIISKAGILLPKDENHILHYNATRQEIIAEVEASLRHFHTDYIDLLLVHRPDVLAHPQDTAAGLEQLVKSGKVLQVGVSNYTPAQVEALQSFLSVPLATNQVELSVKNTQHFFDGTLEDAQRRRMPLMAWSPLGGGSVFAVEDERARALGDMLRELANTYATEPETIAYAWLLMHPAQIAVVTGSSRIERIRQAAAAVSLKLNHEEWYAVLAASRGYHVP